MQQNEIGFKVRISSDSSGLNALNQQTNAATSSIRSMTAAASVGSSGLTGVDKSAASAAKSMQAAATGSADLASLLGNLGNQAGLAAKRFVAMSVVAVTMINVASAVRGAVQGGIAFEKQMAQIGQVSGQSRSQLASLASQIGSVAQAFGASSHELADTSIQLKKLGLDAQETEQALTSIARTSLSVNFDGIKGSTDAAIVAMRQFKLGANELDEALGSINAVSNKFNVSARDVTEAIRVAGSTFKQAGGDMKELISIFASVKGTTEEAAGGIASSLRLVTSRIQRLDVGTALKDLGINLRNTTEEAKKLGNVRLENQFVGAGEAIRRVAAAVRDLQSTDPRYSAILEQLGGARNVARVIPLLQQQGDAQRALTAAQAGSITTLNAAERAQETLANKATKTKEEFLSLGRTFVESTGFQAFANSALSVASALTTILDVVRPLVPLLVTLASIKLFQNVGNISGQFVRRFSTAPGINNTEIKRAGGGSIPGFGDSDSVPAMLTPGEFVINKRSAAAIGINNLHQLNSRHFATGGLVEGRPIIIDPDTSRKLASGGPVYSAFQKRRPLTVTQGYTRSEAYARRHGFFLTSEYGVFEGTPEYAAPETIRGYSGGSSLALLNKIYELRAQQEVKDAESRPKTYRPGMKLSVEQLTRLQKFRDELGPIAKPETLGSLMSRRNLLEAANVKARLNVAHLSAQARKENSLFSHVFGFVDGGLVGQSFDPTVINMADREAVLAFRKRKDPTNAYFQKRTLSPHLDRRNELYGNFFTKSPVALYGRKLDSIYGDLDANGVSPIDPSELHPANPAYIQPYTTDQHFKRSDELEDAYASLRKPFQTSRPSVSLNRAQIGRLAAFRQSLRTRAPAPTERPLGYALGGIVTRASIGGYPANYSDKSIGGLFNDFNNKYGINLRKAASSLSIVGRDDLGEGVLGEYRSKIGHAAIAKSFQQTQLELHATLIHELTHGLDFLGGITKRKDRRGPASYYSKSPAGELAQFYRENVIPQISPSVLDNYGPNYLEYLKKPEESLAHGVHQSLYPNSDPAGFATSLPKGLRRELKSQVLNKVFPYFKHLTSGDKPGIGPLLAGAGLYDFDEYDRVSNVGRQSKVKFFANGGGAHGTDTVPAMLTPGEFVINRDSAAAIGTNNLHRLNSVRHLTLGGGGPGDPSFEGREPTDAEKEIGITSPRYLSEKQANELFLAHRDRIVNAAARKYSGNKQVLREDVESHVDLQGFIHARGFNPSTSINEEVRAQWAKGEIDVNHSAVRSHFVNTALPRVYKSIGEEFFKNKGKGGDTGAEPGVVSSEAEARQARAHGLSIVVPNQGKITTSQGEREGPPLEAAAGLFSRAETFGGQVDAGRKARKTGRYTDEHMINTIRGNAPSLGSSTPLRAAAEGVAPQTVSENTSNGAATASLVLPNNIIGPRTEHEAGRKELRTIRGTTSLPIVPTTHNDELIYALNNLTSTLKSMHSEIKSAAGHVDSSRKVIEGEIVGRTGAGGSGTIALDNGRQQIGNQALIGHQKPAGQLLLGHTPEEKLIHPDDLSPLGIRNRHALGKLQGPHQLGAGDLHDPAVHRVQGGVNREDVFHFQDVFHNNPSDRHGVSPIPVLPGIYPLADGGNVPPRNPRKFATQPEHPEERIPLSDINHDTYPFQGPQRLKGITDRAGAIPLTDVNHGVGAGVDLSLLGVRNRHALGKLPLGPHLPGAGDLNDPAFHRVQGVDRGRNNFISSLGNPDDLVAHADAARNSGFATYGFGDEYSPHPLPAYGPFEPTNRSYRLRKFATRTGSAIGSGISNAYSGVKGAGRDFLNWRSNATNNQNPALQQGLFAAEFATSAASGIINSHRGTAEHAVSGGSTTRYSATGGVSGALTGAATGAALGNFALPGYGAAVGAAVGATYGFVSALKEAEKEIREVKIANSLSDLGSALQGFILDVRGQSLSGVKKHLDKTEQHILGKNADVATGFFGNFDTKQFIGLQKTSNRQELGQLLPSIQAALDKQAESIAKSNLGLTTEELAKKVAEGGEGVNRALLEKVASLRHVSFDAVFNELKKKAGQFQNAERVRVEGLAGNRSQEGASNSFGRLALAFEAASSSLDELRSKALVLADAFDGSAQHVRLSAHLDNLNGIGRPDNGFLQPLSILKDLGGESGKSLYDSGKAANDVSKVLGNVLLNIAKSGPLEGAGYTAGVQSDVPAALGYKSGKTPKEVQDVINIVNRGLNTKSPKEINEAIRTDPTKFIQSLLDPMVGPLVEAAKRSGKTVEEAANEYALGLQRASRIVDAVNSSKYKGAQIGVTGLRSSVGVEAERNFQSGRALDFIKLSELNAPLQERQERLTGLSGDAANDPQAIGAKLAKAREAQQAAADNRQRVLDETKGKPEDSRGDYKKAAKDFQDANSAASRLQQSLSHLSDVTEQAAGIQEKLSRLHNEQHSRDSVAGGLIGASAEDKLKLLRGGNILQQASARGSFDGLTANQQKLAKDAAQTYGNATINFAGGRRTANDEFTRLARNSGGGGFGLLPNFGLDKGQVQEKKSLEDRLADVFKRGAEANKVLTTDLSQANTTFLTNLGAMHNQFFEKLAQYIKGEQITKTFNEKGKVTADLGEAEALKKRSGVLTAAGITTDAQLTSYRENHGSITELRTAHDKIEAAKKLNSKESVYDLFKTVDPANRVANNIFGQQYVKPLNKNHLAKLTQALNDKGFDEDTTPDIVRRVELASVGRGSVEEKQSELRKAISDSLAKYGPQAVERHQREYDTHPAKEKLKNVGLNPESVVAGGAELDESVKDFAGKSLDKLTGKIKTFGDQLEVLNKTLDGLGVSRVPAEKKAAGGSIFSPSGTDTVPAMLSPGEFVVNAASSKANMEALHKINSAKGPAYLAEGGLGGGGAFKWPFPKGEEAGGGGAFPWPFPKGEETGGGGTSPWPLSKDEGGISHVLVGRHLSNNRKTLASLPEDVRKKLLSKISGWHAKGMAEGGVANETDFQKWQRQQAGKNEAPTEVENWKRQQAEKAEVPTDVQKWKQNRQNAAGEGDFNKLPRAAQADNAPLDFKIWLREKREAKNGVHEVPPQPFNPVEDNMPDWVRQGRVNAAEKNIPFGEAFAEANRIGDAAKARKDDEIFAEPKPKVALTYEEIVQERIRNAEAKRAEVHAPLNLPGIAGSEAKKQLEAKLQLLARQNPHGASAGFLIQNGAERQARAQHNAFYKSHGEAISKFEQLKQNANLEGDLPWVIRTREHAQRSLAKLAARDKYLAGAGGRAADVHTTAGDIASFTRRALLANTPGEQGQQVQAALLEQQRQNGTLLNFPLEAARRQRLGNGVPFRFDTPHYAGGGIVPGFGYSDSVPALLTPGEGVLNKGAVASVGESAIQRLNSGGIVKPEYLAGGGQAQGGGADFAGFNEAASKLSEVLNSFAGNATALADAISQMPRSLTGNFTHAVNITLNGADVLSKLQPEIQKMVISQAKEQIGRIFKEQMPEAGVSV